MVTKNRESDDPYYDLIEDFDLIISSFQAQYGIRLSRELSAMKWNEFKALLTGIGSETPLGRIVAIRSEDDPEVLKHFTKSQNEIRNKWRKKSAENKSQEEVNNFLEDMKNMFINMAGGVHETKS
jgi:hypothetical protein